jgi:polar amino acid transport system substrate-binding protein
MFRRMLCGAALALGAMLAFAAAQADARTIDEIIKAGVIKVGVNPNLPPLSSRNAAGDWVGFDIEIANILAQKLGVKTEFVPTEVPARVPTLVSGATDIMMGGLTRTSERYKVIDYTVPLHTENMTLLMTDKVQGVSKWQDFNDEKFTITGCRGCGPLNFANDNIPKAKKLVLDAPADMVRAVAQGRADALIANLDFFPVLMRQYPDTKWVILPNVIRTSYCAIGVKKGNEGLRLFLNQALWELQNDGIHNTLWEKHYGIPPIVKVQPQPYW